MNRQSVTKAQKTKNSTLLPATDILQHQAINRTDYSASTVDTRSPTERQINKPRLPDPESQFNHDFSKIPVRLNSRFFPIQAKLKIGQPNDKYEQEADRVAEQVMRTPDPRLSSSIGYSSIVNSVVSRGGIIQRVCASCSEEEGLILAKTTGGVTHEVTPAISSGIQSLQGGGQPLSGSERGFFEPRFGADFSNVRVHNNMQAANVARSVNARAFTFGQNVVFGAGEYSSDSLAGRKLLAHELMHVVQKNGRTTNFSTGKNYENIIPNPREFSIVSPEIQSTTHPAYRSPAYVHGEGFGHQNADVANIIRHAAATTQPINQISRAVNPNMIIQRQELEPSSPGTPTSDPTTAAPSPSLDVNVESVEVANNTQLDSTLVSSPQLVHDLLTLDPTRFNIYISPVSPVSAIGPLAPINPNSRSAIFPNIPSRLQPPTSPTPTVPSELSLFSAGLFHFRLVFEEPSLDVSEALGESEQRFSQFVNPPSPGIDTGKLIKGLITNFLTQTPPGQAILQGVTGTLGSDNEAGDSGPTVNINLDVLPSPVLQGRPPSVKLNIQGTF